jgi:threonine dehydrogenase-like Zn-dependent dehydrogenase
MLAAVICGPRDIRVKMVEDPSIQKDEIMVKVKACGICGSLVCLQARHVAFSPPS